METCILFCWKGIQFVEPIVFALAMFVPKGFLAVAFDSGGVTTLSLIHIYSKGTEPERHSNNPVCRKVAGRGDTGHSEKSHLSGRYASAEDIYRNKVPICPQGKQLSLIHISFQLAGI